MAKYIQAGDSIECNKSRVSTRKVSTPVPLKIEKADGGFINLLKFKSKTNSNVTITEELNPKVGVISENSHLDLDDELEAQVMEIYIEGSANFKVISNFSNVHGIQSSNIDSFTYAKIVIPFRFLLDRRPAI